MTDLLTPEIDKHRGTVPMGTTQNGIEWALKALHPAGGAHGELGVPDGMTRPTAKWTTTSTFVVQHPSGSGDTWDADLVFMNHPMFQGYYHTIYGAGDAQGNFYNPTLYSEVPDTDAKYNAGLSKFMEMSERYRPLYFGVTLTPIASALANQGTILCAQYPQIHRKLAIDYQSVEGQRPDRERAPVPVMRDGRRTEKPEEEKQPVAPTECRKIFSNKELMMKAVGAAGGAGAVLREAANLSVQTRVSLLDCWTQYYQDLNALTMLPKVYSSNFADGCYAPYKFTPDSREWKNARDVHMYNSVASCLAFELDPTLMQSAAVQTHTPGYPYVIPGYCREYLGWGVLPRGDTNVIHIAIRGMSPSASFKLTIRSGWEIETLPGSTISPFVNGPIEPDPSALTSYSLIIRKLADAYPERYNSWEELVNVIDAASQAAGVVIPGAGIIGKGAKFLYNLFSPKAKPAAEVQRTDQMSKLTNQLKSLRSQVAASASRPPPRLPVKLIEQAPKKKRRNRKKGKMVVVQK